VGCSDLDGWVRKEGGGVRVKGEELFKVRAKLEFEVGDILDGFPLISNVTA